MLKPPEPLTPAGVGALPLDPMLFREGMSRVAGAVHVVTTDGPAGRGGFTATAVTPVTDTPPSLLVCVNASGRTARSLTANGLFCVNTLSIADIAVAETFAGRSDLHGGDRFSIGEWIVLATGTPVLTTSLVAFECCLTDARLVATHHVIIGEIVAIRLGKVRPALVYRERTYHGL
jgi:flavin reductase